MSSAFSALIWWIVPLCALIGALAYVVWVTKFQTKFNNETTRSVTQFQRFQSSFKAQDDGAQPRKDETPTASL